MSTKQRVYMLMRPALWKDLEFHACGIPASVKEWGPEFGLGYVCFYATEEEALEQANDGDIIYPMDMTIKEKVNE